MTEMETNESLNEVLEESLEESLKEKPGVIRDMVGELTDLDACLACREHPDCFANFGGLCTALRRTDENTTSCPFYKNKEENLAEARRCYQRLLDKGRSDLISRYIKPLSALGMLDAEIEAAERYGEEFDNFRESNYLEQLAKMLEDDGLDDDLLEDDLLDNTEDTESLEDDINEPDEGEEDEDAWDTGQRDAWDDGGA